MRDKGENIMRDKGDSIMRDKRYRLRLLNLIWFYNFRKEGVSSIICALITIIDSIAYFLNPFDVFHTYTTDELEEVYNGMRVKYNNMVIQKG